MPEEEGRTHTLSIVSDNGAPRRHQLHFWVGHHEYAFLRKLARSDDEPMSRIVRRLIRQLRSTLENTNLKLK